MTDPKDSAGKKYGDDRIQKTIKTMLRIHSEMVKHFEQDNEAGYGVLAAMLQQLLDERNAVLKDLKALEQEVSYVLAHGKYLDVGAECINFTRSEKYGDTGKAD